MKFTVFALNFKNNIIFYCKASCWKLYAFNLNLVKIGSTDTNMLALQFRAAASVWKTNRTLSSSFVYMQTIFINTVKSDACGSLEPMPFKPRVNSVVLQTAILNASLSLNKSLTLFHIVCKVRLNCSMYRWRHNVGCIVYT